MAGGLVAGSIAIIADSSEKLSDIVYMSVSAFSVWISTKNPNETYSFGYFRAGVIGALMSTVIMWAIAGVLLYEAIDKVINLDKLVVDGKIMFITAISGFAINIIVMIVLTTGMKDEEPETEAHADNSKKGLQSAEEETGRNPKPEESKDKPKNQNLHAVILDIMGDMVMSILTIIASVLCWCQPDRLKLADLICSMFFPVVCFLVTRPIIKETIRTLMEGSPPNLSPAKLRQTLMGIPGVLGVHDLHVWALSSEQASMSTHIKVKTGGARIVSEVTKVCRELGYQHTTIQVEEEASENFELLDCSFEH